MRHDRCLEMVPYSCGYFVHFFNINNSYIYKVTNIMGMEYGWMRLYSFTTHTHYGMKTIVCHGIGNATPHKPSPAR